MLGVKFVEERATVAIASTQEHMDSPWWFGQPNHARGLARDNGLVRFVGAHCTGYFENDWSLNGDVIIGDVLGTLMTMKPTLALVWQLLHAEVIFSKALPNFVSLFASIASRIS
jgi:hypothetical protein